MYKRLRESSCQIKMTFLFYRETIGKDLKDVTEKVGNASAKLRAERIMLMKVGRYKLILWDTLP